MPVRVQGTDAHMVLDMASSLSSMSAQAVEKFGLHTTEIPKTVEVRQGTHPLERYASVAEFSLGKVRYRNEKFIVNPAPHDARPLPADGTLGIDLLWRFDLELNLAQRKLNLYSPHADRARVVYWSDHYDVVPLLRGPLGEFYFPMELDGRKIETVFSTANRDTTLSTDVTKRVFNFDRNSPGVESTTDAGGKTTSYYRAMQLTASALKVSDERVKLVESPIDGCWLAKKSDGVGYQGCFGRYPLQLGSDTLAKLHLYIATQENRLYFTAADQSPAP